MPKFISKPTEIEAVQFWGDNYEEILQFVGNIGGSEDPGFILYPGTPEDGLVAQVWDKLHNSWVGVKHGQWIIRGTKGEYYPCDEDVFEAKYDEVE